MIYNDVLNKVGEEKKIVKMFTVNPGESVEMETIMDLAAPQTHGDTLIKVVVRENGYLKLTGKIKIEKDARGANGFLRQAVLLVGKGARAEAIPELEIECEDVKASHAASVGRIDEEQLFYLESRGLSRKEAVELVIKAFLS